MSLLHSSSLFTINKNLFFKNGAGAANPEELPCSSNFWRLKLGRITCGWAESTLHSQLLFAGTTTAIQALALQIPLPGGITTNTVLPPSEAVSCPYLSTLSPSPTDLNPGLLPKPWVPRGYSSGSKRNIYLLWLWAFVLGE